MITRCGWCCGVVCRKKWGRGSGTWAMATYKNTTRYVCTIVAVLMFSHLVIFLKSVLVEESKPNDTCSAVAVRRGTVLKRAVVHHPVSLQRYNTRNIAVVQAYVHPEKKTTRRAKKEIKREERERKERKERKARPKSAR